MRSNTKAVQTKIRKHIMEYYDNVEHLRADVNAVKGYGGRNTDWSAGQYLAKSGNFLIATQDMENFLNSLGINPTGKKYPADKVFETYTSLIGREVANILRIKR